MKPQKRLVRRIISIFSALVAVILNQTVQAQNVLVPPPATVADEPIWQQNQTNIFQVFTPSGVSPISPDQPFQFGPVIARPHFYYQFTYATGLQFSPGQQHDTLINTISPGIVFDIGQHWALDYTPTLVYYSSRFFNNELNHAVSLTWAADYQDWNFGFSQGYSLSSSPQAATGGQTQQEGYQTSLTASHALSSKMSLDMSLSQSINFSEDLFTNNATSQNTYNWSTMEWLNYAFWPQLNAGVGAGVGYASVNIGPNQLYENVQGRMNWRATDKISLSLNGGFQEMQLLNGSSDLFNPLYGASLQYQPFAQTQISLNANRTVSSSTYFVQNSVTETTTLGLSVSQRLLGKYHLSLSGGYSNTKYTESIEPFSSNREDNDYSFNARLSREFLKRGTIAVVYQYTDNHSNTAGYTYSSNQIGFELQYAY